MNIRDCCFSHITYAVNDCHIFQLIVYGSVMEKIVNLPQEYFEFLPVEQKQCFYPRFLNILLVNALKASVGFEWFHDNNLNFHIKPKKVDTNWFVNKTKRFACREYCIVCVCIYLH